MQTKLDAVASRLWFEYCDLQGWPNGLPTWSEMKTFTTAPWVERVREYETMAAAAIEVCEHFDKVPAL